MASELRHLSTWKRIYVTPDLTKKEREESKRLREEFAARRQAGETDITIRRGRIIRLPANTSEAAGAPVQKKMTTSSVDTVSKHVASPDTENTVAAQATAKHHDASVSPDHTGPPISSGVLVSACPVPSESASEPIKTSNTAQNNSEKRSQD